MTAVIFNGVRYIALDEAAMETYPFQFEVICKGLSPKKAGELSDSLNEKFQEV